MEPLELRFTVACSPEHAFDVWARQISLWWPPGHSVSAAPRLTVTFEPLPGWAHLRAHAGGRRARVGRGPRVGAAHRLGLPLAPCASTAATPPRSISRSRQAEAGGTTVTIVHRGWERVGAKGPERRERNRRGWEGLIPHYRQTGAAS